MRSYLAATVLLTVGLTLPHTALAQSAMPQVDWTGAYVGVQAGYATGRGTTGDIRFYDSIAGTTLLGSLSGFAYSLDGHTGGGEAGYNWQVGNVVLGMQADLSAANVTGSYADSVNKFSLDSKLSWLATLRAQVGLAYDRFLVFGTAGVASGGLQGNLHDYYKAGTVTTSSGNTSIGYVLGGGVAAALDSHWSVKAEFLHVDLGTQSYRFYEPPSHPPLIASDAAHVFDTVRFGLDYRF